MTISLLEKAWSLGPELSFLVSVVCLRSACLSHLHGHGLIVYYTQWVYHRHNYFFTPVSNGATINRTSQPREQDDKKTKTEEAHRQNKLTSNYKYRSRGQAQRGSWSLQLQSSVWVGKSKDARSTKILGRFIVALNNRELLYFVMMSVITDGTKRRTISKNS